MFIIHCHCFLFFSNNKKKIHLFKILLSLRKTVKLFRASYDIVRIVLIWPARHNGRSTSTGQRHSIVFCAHSLFIPQYWYQTIGLVVVGDACHTQHSTASHTATLPFFFDKRLSLSPVDLSSCGTLSDASNLFFFFISQFLGAPRWLRRIRWTQPFVRLFTAAHRLGAALAPFVCFSFFGRRNPSPGASVVGALGVSQDGLEGSQLMLFFCLFVLKSIAGSSHRKMAVRPSGIAGKTKAII